jgi:glutamate formiminotransferase/formiminotetrahydrofolate cyclodeaminase
VTDAGVGALAIRSCIRGAFLNVKINAAGLDDKKFTGDIISRGCDIEVKAILEEEEILKMVEAEIVRQSRN